MRVEYRLEISKLDVPRFSVEAQERIGKLFTLATLVFNILDSKPVVEIVFHGLSSEDPARKIAAFKEIIASVTTGATPSFAEGTAGQLTDSSIYFQWLKVQR